MSPPFFTVHDEIEIEQVRVEFKDTAFILEFLSIVAIWSLEENLFYLYHVKVKKHGLSLENQHLDCKTVSARKRQFSRHFLSPVQPTMGFHFPTAAIIYDLYYLVLSPLPDIPQQLATVVFYSLVDVSKSTRNIANCVPQWRTSG